MASKKKLIEPDYLFEVSWEVCNKVGGIYTVIATKALYLQSQLGRKHIFIGPDVWMHRVGNPDFLEDQHLYQSWRLQAQSEGLRFRVGRWNIPGKPIAILVDYKHLLPEADDILAGLWRDFGVDSISGNWDYKESAVFGYAAGKVIESFWNYNLDGADKAVAQFHEWQTGAGLLYIRSMELPIATTFTTHATVVGRCLAGNNLPLYDDMDKYIGSESAKHFHVQARHLWSRSLRSMPMSSPPSAKLPQRSAPSSLAARSMSLHPTDSRTALLPAAKKSMKTRGWKPVPDSLKLQPQ